MQYVRTYTLQSSHLNSAQAYQILWSAVQRIPPLPSVAEMIIALRACHGHNFKVEVALEGEMPSLPWLVDDIVLTDIVMEWDNTNLSLHPDFLSTQSRATTENMAAVLITKLRKTFPGLVKKVTIWETDNIYAVTS